MNESVAELSDQQVTLVLQHLAAEIMPDDAKINAFVSRADAVALVNAVLDASAAQGEVVVESEEQPAELGRALVGFATQQVATAALANDLLADPPDDDQMAIGDLADNIVQLGFVVAVLQTRFRIAVSRRDGKSSIEAEIAKRELSEPLMKQFLGIARALVDPSGRTGE